MVATGFTSALLGDERTLREFVMGDRSARALQEAGRNVTLYLINDTYDPLNGRQLRIGVNKDPELFQLFSGFCGRPIAEIPDPFQCHDSYAGHFAAALMARLHDLDIHPCLLDSYRAYAAGDYAPFVTITFERYAEIQAALRAEFPGFEPNDLFRIQCPACSCLDATSVVAVHGNDVDFACRRCGGKERRPWRSVRGKLTWKLDCAARWNLYGIQVEAFAKAHVAALGTYPIASFVSRRFFGGVVPEPAPYGHVRISRECSGKLLRILPPAALKRLMGENPTRDLQLTRESVGGFCRKFQIRPGLSYVDFVRRELPRLAMKAPDDAGEFPGRTDRFASCHGEADLVRYANRYSTFFYGRSYGTRCPDLRRVADAVPPTAALAREALEHALLLRRRPDSDPETTRAAMKHFFANQPPAPALHPYLRAILRQEGGPALASLFALVPLDHLELIHSTLVLQTTHRDRSPNSVGRPGVKEVSS